MLKSRVAHPTTRPKKSFPKIERSLWVQSGHRKCSPVSTKSKECPEDKGLSTATRWR